MRACLRTPHTPEKHRDQKRDHIPCKAIGSRTCMAAYTKRNVRIPLVFCELGEATGAEHQGIRTPDPRVVMQRLDVCCFRYIV